MVAVIKTGYSVNSILHYNENKVKEGVAQCIGEGNYPAAVQELNFPMKLNRLKHQNALNRNVKRNSVHISLNFHPLENYSNEKLMKIADAYMEKVGFAEQPYLVYRHDDAGHPHIHLVSIKVRQDGSRIDLQNIGRNQSEKARKEIEKQFNLVRAQGRKTDDIAIAKPVAASKVSYGRTESKKAIWGVLDSVVPHYKYASLAELNAVLQLYNIKADRGSEDSRIFKSGGLVYRILGKDGKAVGVPIKASDFPIRPTLDFLEKRYALSAAEKGFEKKRIRCAVDAVFLTRNMDIGRLVYRLEKQGIDVVLRRSDQGQLYGITYVDHLTKCVFNGSALGKNYSAKGMLERCIHHAAVQMGRGAETAMQKEKNEIKDMAFEKTSEKISGAFAAKAIDELFRSQCQLDAIASGLKAKRRRRKKKGRSNLS